MAKALYEIVNPSDKVLVAAESDQVAAIAILVLGMGRFALVRCDNGERVLPLFLLGGAEEWLAAQHIDLGTFVKEHAVDLAAVFDSAFYGDASEAEALEAALAALAPLEREASRRAYNDRKRSSMNNIGAACISWAERCREVANGG